MYGLWINNKTRNLLKLCEIQFYRKRFHLYSNLFLYDTIKYDTIEIIQIKNDLDMYHTDRYIIFNFNFNI